MPSLQEVLAKNRAKGIGTELHQNPILKDDSAAEVALKMVRAYTEHTPAKALHNASTSLDGFVGFWSGERAKALGLHTPEEYLSCVNECFEAYGRLRRKLDGSVAFLLGDFLLECRSRFFPEAEHDRKEAGQWSLFLQQHLCKGFSKSFAYACMQIARELDSLRGRSLLFTQLRAALQVQAKGGEVGEILESMTESEIRALVSDSEPTEPAHELIRLQNSLGILRRRLERLSPMDKHQHKDLISSLHEEAKAILSLLSD